MKDSKAGFTNKVIIAAIAVLAAVFAACMIAFAARSSKKSGFGGGGGGSYGSADSYGSGFELDVSRHDIALGDKDNVVTFTAVVGCEASVVNLADEKGNTVVKMNDEGKDGDAQSGDGIYTAMVRFDTSVESSRSYCAIVDSQQKSQTETVSIISAFTDSELTAMAQADQRLEAAMASGKTKDEKQQAVTAALQELENEGLIQKGSVMTDNNSGIVTFYYQCGVIGGVQPEGFSSVYAGSAGSPQAAAIQKMSGGANGRALILYAFEYPPEGADLYERCVGLKYAWDKRGLSTRLEFDVTIDDMRGIANRDFVYVAAHGGSLTFQYKPDNKKWFSQYNTSGIVVPGVFLKESVTVKKDRAYALGLKSGRIIKVNGCYGIVPAFFDEYYRYGSLSDTIFYLGACGLMGSGESVDEQWADMFNSKSVKAFVGYHNKNYAHYHISFLAGFAEVLLDGKTVEDAFNKSLEINGKDDVEWFGKPHDESWWGAFTQKLPQDETPHPDAAFPVLRGNRSAVLG